MNLLDDSALQESENRFRSLLDLSSDWYWEQDEQFRFTMFAGTNHLFHGVSRHRYGKHRWDQSYFNMTEADWAEHKALLEARKPFRDLELCRLNEAGEKVWISTSGEPVFDPAGRFKGYRGVGRDITRRRVAEQAIRDSEQRFNAFMDNAPAVAWIKDSRLRYSYISKAYEKFIGRRAEEFLGREDYMIWPEEIARQMRHTDEMVLRGRAPIQVLQNAPHPDGTEHTWLQAKFPLPDASGAPGIGGMAIDATKHVEAERSANHYAEEARALLGRLIATQENERKLLATQLHDLIGQNLSALGIGLSNIARLVPDSVQLAAMSRTVEETISAIRDVMTDLRPPTIDEYGLLPALRGYAAEFEARTSLRVTVEALNDLPRLTPSLELTLFRMAQEALANAAKHSGGTAARIFIEQSESRVRLVVEDNGRGFTNPRGARRTRAGGWGLPAMRERAEAHNGELRLEFPGTGTRVVAEIPLPRGQ
jgi:PAS domain S-box-containing protein